MPPKLDTSDLSPGKIQSEIALTRGPVYGRLKHDQRLLGALGNPDDPRRARLQDNIGELSAKLSHLDDLLGPETPTVDSIRRKLASYALAAETDPDIDRLHQSADAIDLLSPTIQAACADEIERFDTAATTFYESSSTDEEASPAPTTTNPPRPTPGDVAKRILARPEPSLATKSPPQKVEATPKIDNLEQSILRAIGGIDSMKISRLVPLIYGRRFISDEDFAELRQTLDKLTKAGTLSLSARGFYGLAGANSSPHTGESAATRRRQLSPKSGRVDSSQSDDLEEQIRQIAGFSHPGRKVSSVNRHTGPTGKRRRR